MPMTTKTKLTVVVGALVLVLAALATVKVITFPSPCQLLKCQFKESVVISVRMQGGECVIAKPEQITTKREHALTWTIKGSCDNHTVSVEKFTFVKDGRPLDPTEELTKEAKAEDGQKIKARVKDNDNAAPDGKYTYQVLVRIDGQPVDGDPAGELLICPEWPCG